MSLRLIKGVSLLLGESPEVKRVTEGAARFSLGGFSHYARSKSLKVFFAPFSRFSLCERPKVSGINRGKARSGLHLWRLAKRESERH